MRENSLLARVLEPEVMDAADEARDYDAMDHGEVNRRFVADFLAVEATCRLGAAEVLDVGTGTAQIPIELCRRHEALRVVAIDLASSMLALAAENVNRAGLSRRITLERVDAKGLPFADGRFAAVISNSIVHHIPEPGAALAEMLRVLRPGGLVFVRDLARPYDEALLRQQVETYAAGCNPHQRALFAASLHAALTLGEVRQLVARFGWQGESVSATSDRHWTWAGAKAAA